MDYTHTFHRADGAEIEVTYTAKPGTPDSWLEPGDPPEIEIMQATDVTGAEVLDTIPADEVEKWEEHLYETHDFDDYDDYDDRGDWD